MKTQFFRLALLALAVAGCGSAPTLQTEDTPAVAAPTFPSAASLPPQLKVDPKLNDVNADLQRVQPAYHAAPAYVYAQGKIGRLASSGEFHEVYNRANRLAGRPDFDMVSFLASQPKAGEQ